MNEKQRINKEFDALSRSILPKDTKITQKDYENLLLFHGKSAQQEAKKTDYGFYAIIIFIFILLMIILIILYYTTPKVVTAIDNLIDDKNKSDGIEIEEYDNEDLEE